MKSTLCLAKAVKHEVIQFGRRAKGIGAAEEFASAHYHARRQAEYRKPTRRLDKEFANEQVTAHEEAVELYRQASEELEDGDLKAFALRTLPVLEMHLVDAQALKTQTDQS